MSTTNREKLIEELTADLQKLNIAEIRSIIAIVSQFLYRKEQDQA